MESVTSTLQMQSKAAKARLEGSTTSDMNNSSISLNTEPPSITSSVEPYFPHQVEHDRDASSSLSHAGEVAQSWVEQFTEQSSPAGDVEAAPHGIPRDQGSPSSSSGAHLSDSVTSASVSLVSGSDGVVRIPMHSCFFQIV